MFWKRICGLLALTAAMIPASSVAQGRIVVIEKPKMTVYLPSHSVGSGKSVIVCPGGGYSHLAKNHEGHDWAHWFNDNGIACAVLEYRMPKGDRNIPLADVDAAFKVMKDSATVWKINPDSIGIMGSSAGGHLAATVSTHPTAASSPAFQILFYPVVSLDSLITHKGTRKNFLGENAGDDIVAEYSSENKVSASTSPAFIALSADDGAVSPENSLRYFSALNRAGVSAAMFIYPTGGHGWGYRPGFKYHSQMLGELKAWLESH